MKTKYKFSVAINSRLRCLPARQRGVVLLVSLLFLVVLTLIGVAASRMVTSEERQSRYLREYSTAFEAAEAALRDARDEIVPFLATGSSYNLAGASTKTASRVQKNINFTQACTAGLCTYDDINPPWKDPARLANAVSYGTYTLRSPLPKSNIVGTTVTGASGKDELGVDTDRFNQLGTETSAVTGVSKQPVYLIEAIKDKRPGANAEFNNASSRTSQHFLYRITARGFGADPNSQATVQEVYSGPL
jgi:type IV pilus assembly protein PilX